MRVPKRIPPFTKPCRRLPPKIPNPLPKTTSGPKLVEGNCIFHDLRQNAAPPPTLFEKLPPLLKNPVGRSVLPGELEKMRSLRSANSKRWTITALSTTFKVSRSYVISKVLSAGERKQAKDELVEMIDSLSLNEKRGWLMRYKIREHRRDLW